MYMDKGTLKNLHNKELEILKTFIEICNKLNLKYFAVYGTALGAVRHKGFIPWDDDIDVAMLREDFERFLKEAPALLPPHLFLQYRDTDPDYNILHAKLRDSNTTFLEPGWEKQKGNQGVFIDIFSWDYIPTKGISAFIFKLKKKYYQNIIATDPKANYWKSPGIKNKIRAILQPFINWLYPSRQRAARKFDNILKNLPPHTLVGNHESTYTYSLEWVKDVKPMSFENLIVNVPAGVHEHLTTCYGDYMQLPPEEEQVPLHFGGVIDTERPYTYYTEKPLN